MRVIKKSDKILGSTKLKGDGEVKYFADRPKIYEIFWMIAVQTMYQYIEN